MTQQHLHAKIGDVIRTCKVRLFRRLKEGADLEDVIAQFIGEVRLGLQTIARAEAESKNLNSDCVQHSI